jgi:hypothetical protein
LAFSRRSTRVFAVAQKLLYTPRLFRYCYEKWKLAGNTLLTLQLDFAVATTLFLLRWFARTPKSAFHEDNSPCYHKLCYSIPYGCDVEPPITRSGGKREQIAESANNNQ